MPTQTIGPQHARELQEIADSICRSGQVLMVTGAGISTNSGIPDFRSANGLYNLVKRRYPDQTALLKGRDLFDAISFTNPVTTSILYSFLAELRQTVKSIRDSTPTHKFIKTLSETGRLLRCYTQNIDGLEALDGLCMDITRGAGKRGKGKDKVGRETGCEVVQLHGDLEMLRCTQCAKLHDYDEERIDTLLGGEAPECPDCSKKADDRMAAGKRGINVGTLRPNIVLYDELHPQGEAIGQLTHYDATRNTPDLLLIFGTSLKVIGLKRIVKAFAAKVKTRGGKVVYINATPAADSIWGDIIDYHIEMDCDAWIKDLKLRRNEIWLHQSLLDKEWRKTKPSSVPSLKKSKTTTGYESDKENSEKLKGQPLVRRKSLSALPSKKKSSAPPKSKQLPTPTNTPRKKKPKSLPTTPATGASKRSHRAAFPQGTSPLTSLRTTPSSSFLNTPNKRVRISSSLPPMNATTPPHWNRIQDLRTPQRPSPGAYSWLTIPSSRDSSTRSSATTPVHQRTLPGDLNTPSRPVPDSPFLSEAGFDSDTEDKYTRRRFFLDHISVPPVPSAPSDYEPMTPKRPRTSEVSSITNSVSTSARRSAKKQGLSVDEIYVDKTPSPTPTRGGTRTKILDDVAEVNLEKPQLPTPPASQIPSDQVAQESEEEDISAELELSLLKYRPRQRKKKVFEHFVADSFERLDSDVSEASEQLEREVGMALEGSEVPAMSKTTEPVDLLPEPKEPLEPGDKSVSLPPPMFSTPQPSKPTSNLLTSTPSNDNITETKRISTPPSLPAIERRKTRGLQKEEELQKILSKPGTVTRREAERRKSLREGTMRKVWI
ncbi:hypothetical protein ABW19_dt0204130 [Dactylella cylindrospora]|nr:hypothetical protein ABW19_dt0204130 [Dactylella cylindrospora]